MKAEMRTSVLLVHCWCALIHSACFFRTLEGVKLEGDILSFKDYEKISDRQSPLDHIASEGKNRAKRHTADHLISDKFSRYLKSSARTRTLTKLLKMAGTSRDSSCDCGFSQNGVDVNGRAGTDGLYKKSDEKRPHECKCDTASAIKYLLLKLRDAKGGEGKELDPFSQYISRLSETGKHRLRQFLHEEGRRIRRNELRRRIRRRRILRRILQRRRRLRNDPSLAFRGKQFLSF